MAQTTKFRVRKRSSDLGGVTPEQMMASRRQIIEGDRTLWIIFAVLLVISVLVVYSSTAKMAYDVTMDMTTTDSLRQQVMLIVLALPLIFIVHKIDYRVYRSFTPLMYYLFVVLTLATYFVGATTNGAARWLPIGSFQFQPSEGLKIMTVLMLARRMENRQNEINTLKLLPTSWRTHSSKMSHMKCPHSSGRILKGAMGQFSSKSCARCLPSVCSRIRSTTGLIWRNLQCSSSRKKR